MARVIPMYERETTLTWNDEEKTVILTTASATTMRKLDRLVAETNGLYKRVNGLDDAKSARYTFPAKFVRYGRPKKVSPEHMAKLHASRKPKED